MGSEDGVSAEDKIIVDDEMPQEFGDDFNKWLTRRTLEKKGKWWTECGKWNLTYLLKRNLLRSFTQLTYRFYAMPTLILGWGPTFHEHLEDLASLPRNKLRIIASDRCVQRLEEIHIKPDAVVNLDAGEQIKPFVQPYNLGNVPGIFSILTHPGHLWEHWYNGPLYWFLPAVHPDGNTIAHDFHMLAPELPILPTGGNVGATAAVVAWMMGAKPILLLGIEMGFDKKTKEVDIEYSITDQKNKKKFEGAFDPVMYAYAWSTRKIFKEVLKDAEVINLSRGLLHGPYIKDAEFPKFKREILKWKKPKELDIIQKKLRTGEMKFGRPLLIMPGINDCCRGGRHVDTEGIYFRRKEIVKSWGLKKWRSQQI